MPELSLPILSFLRMMYGILLFLTLVSFLPLRRQFFLSERWGGYAESGPTTDLIQNPYVYPSLLASWLISAACLACGFWSILAAGVNLIFCRYFFIQRRWKSLCRGMGAPGYITYWLAVCVLLLELTTHYAPSLQSLALLVLQVDFATLFFLSGIYKYASGYRSGQGMELGVVNPQWGYWWRRMRTSNPNQLLHRLNNTLAWTVEMLTAVLMVIPELRFLGGLLLILSFIYIAFWIRLGLLPEMVMLIGFLFFTKGSPPDQWLQSMLAQVPLSSNPAGYFAPLVSNALEYALYGYLCLLPVAYAGLCINFYWKKSLPSRMQWLLEHYTNFFGMILWRVFSVDVINFFIRIYRSSDSKERTLVSAWGWNRTLRWGHVCEAITVTCIFTTLKYFASNRQLFENRLLRYARTLSCQPNESLIFTYVSVEKATTEFVFRPVREFHVSPLWGTVNEHVFDLSQDITRAAKGSPVHETAHPGTYAPLLNK
jgi:hypothetical protein